jgi:two-component system chemotaxis response regulator CheB
MVTNKYELIVIGGSAGAYNALTELLPIFPIDYPLPIVIVQHLHPLQDVYFIEHFAKLCKVAVKEAGEKETIQNGTIYFAPPNYHLLIEDDKTFSLSIDEKVNYSRPSIDVLFDSAAYVYGARTIAVILTGANNDGAKGIRQVKESGGLAIVQDPETASSSYMPNAALELTQADYVLSPKEIGKLLVKITQ